MSLPNSNFHRPSLPYAIKRNVNRTFDISLLAVPLSFDFQGDLTEPS